MSSSGNSTTKSLASSLVRTSQLLREHVWIRPLIIAAILSCLGWYLYSTVEKTMKQDMMSELQTILDADVTALTIWLEAEEANAKVISNRPDVRWLVDMLALQANEPDMTRFKLLSSQEMKQLREIMTHWLKTHHYAGFAVATPDGRLIASDRDDQVLPENFELDPEIRSKIQNGESFVTRPFLSKFPELDKNNEPKIVPVMYAIAPVHDGDGEVVAGIGIRIFPDKDFTRILSVASPGDTGETYAFDKTGLLLSQSRFDKEMRQVGILPMQEDATSILRLRILDPEVNRMRGEHLKKDVSELQLTRMAQAAIAGEDGIDVDGYRDYRGQIVVGAWRWLADYGMGVATEVQIREAYSPLYIIRWVFGVLFALLILSAIAILVFMVINRKLQLSVRRAVLEARQLGQYALETKIGAGGMGVVYKARHAMLRRPTAVKLLDVDRTTDETVARFEREVQLTSQLNHPNTIAIYDYGRTPEGVFYYAMEYLDGISLEHLVEHYGPQPEGRVVFILTQICGSLAEAHGVGLIHRDIKPANILLNRRGGMYDHVKVLDFGLVKAVDAIQQTSLTGTHAITGTPLYMAPESIERPDEVDARSDLYAVAAVGYFLLTGTPVFEGQSVLEICRNQLQAIPESPSKRLGKRVSKDLESILLRCLQKQKEDRIATAQEMIELLAECGSAQSWGRSQALAWWDFYEQSREENGPQKPTEREPSHSELTVVYQINPVATLTESR